MDNPTKIKIQTSPTPQTIAFRDVPIGAFFDYPSGPEEPFMQRMDNEKYRFEGGVDAPDSSWYKMDDPDERVILLDVTLVVHGVAS